MPRKKGVASLVKGWCSFWQFQCYFLFFQRSKGKTAKKLLHSSLQGLIPFFLCGVICSSDCSPTLFFPVVSAIWVASLTSWAFLKKDKEGMLFIYSFAFTSILFFWYHSRHNLHSLLPKPKQFYHQSNWQKELATNTL